MLCRNVVLICCLAPAPAPQSEVEQFYIDKGWLLPSFHKSYWIGLRSAQWPTFK